MAICAHAHPHSSAAVNGSRVRGWNLIIVSHRVCIFLCLALENAHSRMFQTNKQKKILQANLRKNYFKK
jgi:hypothetical protein